jgi:hypothetical protein
MSDTIINLDQTEEFLADEVSDEALEVAATGEGGRGASFSAVCGTPTGW